MSNYEFDECQRYLNNVASLNRNYIFDSDDILVVCPDFLTKQLNKVLVVISYFFQKFVVEGSTWKEKDDGAIRMNMIKNKFIPIDEEGSSLEESIINHV